MNPSIWSGPPVVFVRARGLVRAGVVLLLYAGADRMVPDGLRAVPFRPGVSVTIATLLPAVPGIFVAAMCERPDADLEPIRSWRLRLARLLWFGLLFGSCVMIGAMTLNSTRFGFEVSLRNVALSFGVTMLGAQVVPPIMAWFPTAAYVAVTFFYGSKDAVGQARGWAWLLQGPTSVWAAVCSAVVLVLAALAYVVRDRRAGSESVLRT